MNKYDHNCAFLVRKWMRRRRRIVRNGMMICQSRFAALSWSWTMKCYFSLLYKQNWNILMLYSNFSPCLRQHSERKTRTKIYIIGISKSQIGNSINSDFSANTIVSILLAIAPQRKLIITPKTSSKTIFDQIDIEVDFVGRDCWSTSSSLNTSEDSL